MILKRRLATSMSVKASQGVRRKMMDRLLRMDYQSLQSAKEANMIADLQYGVDSLSDMLVDGVPMLIPSVISVALCLGAMAFIDWRLMLLSLPVFLLMVALYPAQAEPGIAGGYHGHCQRKPGCAERILQEFTRPKAS